ncbi:MAG: acyltransferase [Leptospiraceae bacterium]|nr:acyltransferase [Leptospiraceae bacterium]
MKYFDLLKQVFFTRKGELRSLNGLRALAILLVLLHHIQPLLENIPNTNPIIHHFFGNFVSGVDLFFILSGYLISKELQNTWNKYGKIDFKNFYLKRTLRIFPAYYFFLTVIFVIYTIIINNPKFQTLPQYKDIIKVYSWWPMDFIYMSDYFKGIHIHTWSLSVEEKFYLVLPFFVHFIYFRLAKKSRLYTLSLLYFLPLLFRFITFYNTDFSLEGYRIYYTHYPIHARFDALLLGIILMELHTNWNILAFLHDKVFLRFQLYLISFFILFLSHIVDTSKVNSIYFQVLNYNGFDIGFAILFLLCLDENSIISKVMSFQIFTPIARLSYTIYLWHIHIFITATNGTQISKKVIEKGTITWLEFGTVFLYGVLVIMIWSFFLYAIVEAPFLYLKERLKKTT